MGRDLAEPDWPPLVDEEVDLVLAHYDVAGAGRPPRPVIRWRSPRPMSAAALVRCGGAEAFVKRHHVAVRTAAQLAAEHAFADHLRAHGVPIPQVWRTRAGATTVRAGDYVYEVHAHAPGIDLYRDAPSWTPFTSTGHARAAGAALARFHRAARSFARPQRPPGVLMNSCSLVMAPDPLAALDRLLRRRPGLARSLAGRQWRDDIARYHLPAIESAAPLVRALGRQWGHGDWHPSNLTWDSASPDAGVAAVIDLGLANRTFAAHDLAVAIERSAVPWLDLAENGQAEPDIPAARALLDGYLSARRLSDAELAALPLLLPVVHTEYALSEVEYFASVVRSPGHADLAYDTYLIGHARWFGTPDGRALLSHLQRWADRQPTAP